MIKQHSPNGQGAYIIHVKRSTLKRSSYHHLAVGKKYAYQASEGERLTSRSQGLSSSSIRISKPNSSVNECKHKVNDS